MYIYGCVYTHTDTYAYIFTGTHISYMKGGKEHILVAHSFHSFPFVTDTYQEPILLGTVLRAGCRVVNKTDGALPSKCLHSNWRKHMIKQVDK